ncbi:DNase I-like protein [Aaosphaeria arxii CBS 175.79]|uniref:DNase I-like protein n=1 Tax=Aaosphaeria arxii CBS 175.79 TaxID=1450172 RepID=A0A6A5Y0A5_9PLEO|nr:DNase I-like protein [Aaosphaeria arxii CBS 175.79]KAF2018689.1 DNase I-like protein [Aaosphaeria arxii CBS 175.79]
MHFLIPFSSLLAGLGALVSAAPNPTGALSLAQGKDPFTFDYTAPSANAKNWIGIYHITGGGPDQEKQVDPSLTWKYAPAQKGSIKIDVPFGGGKFKAYFLANDGYTWIANPIEISAPTISDGKQFKVLSWNLWHGGTKINGYHEKQIKFIKDQAVDVVGLQEATGDHAQRLANALGWNYHQNNGQNTAGIISRFPITKRHANLGARTAGVELAINSDKTKPFNFWSLHTTAYPYGPYEFCFESKTSAQVDQAEISSGRVSEIKAVIDGTKAQRESNAAFILVGDFNSPSHLDWTAANKHCDGKVGAYAWPVTKYATEQGGLTDTFRKIHPDPKATPGETWSPIVKTNSEAGSAGKKEPQDRIDFIFANAKLSAVDSQVKVVGMPSENYVNNEWTSDHASVITTFKTP